MVVIYFQTQTGVQSAILTPENSNLLAQAIWVDSLNINDSEEKMLEQFFQLNIPTKKEVEEIELSSRLYSENNTLFMTATMVAQSESPEVKTDVVTFILTNQVLITLRYTELHAFTLYKTRIMQCKKLNANKVMLGLLEAAVDRLADILEKISHEFDKTSMLIFHSDEDANKNISYKKILFLIGSHGDLGTKARESLISFTRIISFLGQTDEVKLSKTSLGSLAIIDKDVNALSDYAAFLSTKFSFLLDATLGMISLEQNNIIKIFTVAAVLFLPPTLIASIYGMNFTHMPELGWHIGYPLAIGLMVFSAWLPFHYFKKKKWL